MPAARRLSAYPFLLVLTLSALWAALCLAAPGAAADGLLELTRLTARTSVFFFLAAFAASSLVRLWPSEVARALLVNRRSIGLAFALAHFIHLAALTAYFIVSAENPGTVAIIGGGLAYIFIALMAVTSNNAAVRHLGRNWKRLHTVGGWYIWLIFLNSYLGRTLDGRAPVALFGAITALLALAALIRFAAWLTRKRALPERAS